MTNFAKTNLRRLKRQKKLDASIDMTPLIDIIFQLIIFLLVSSQFVKPAKKVTLPTGAAAGETVKKNTPKTVLIITKENTIIHNKRHVKRNDIGNYLNSLHRKGQLHSLEIKADQGSYLGIFIETIEYAKKIGIENISYHKQEDV